jgi:hypothetical protein
VRKPRSRSMRGKSHPACGIPRSARERRVSRGAVAGCGRAGQASSRAIVCCRGRRQPLRPRRGSIHRWPAMDRRPPNAPDRPRSSRRVALPSALADSTPLRLRSPKRCGVRVLGCATIVENECRHTGCFGDVSRPLAVARRRADGEAAAVHIEQHSRPICAKGKSPDPRHASHNFFLVGDVLRLPGRLMPFVEDAPEQSQVQLAGRHRLRPVLVEITQCAIH